MLKATEAIASVDTEQWPRAGLEPSALSVPIDDVVLPRPAKWSRVHRAFSVIHLPIIPH